MPLTLMYFTRASQTVTLNFLFRVVAMKEVNYLMVFQIASMETCLIRTGTFSDMATVCYTTCK